MVSFPQFSPPKPCIHLSSHPIRATSPAHHILLDLITRTLLGEEYRSLSFSLRSFLHSPRYIVPLGPKYSPQHPILKHPQPTFLPQCQRPSFTPIQNNRSSYITKGQIRQPYHQDKETIVLQHSDAANCSNHQHQAASYNQHPRCHLVCSISQQHHILVLCNHGPHTDAQHSDTRQLEQDSQCAYNVTLRSVRATIDAVEKK